MQAGAPDITDGSRRGQRSAAGEAKQKAAKKAKKQARRQAAAAARQEERSAAVAPEAAPPARPRTVDDLEIENARLRAVLKDQTQLLKVTRQHNSRDVRVATAKGRQAARKEQKKAKLGKKKQRLKEKLAQRRAAGREREQKKRGRQPRADGANGTRGAQGLSARKLENFSVHALKAMASARQLDTTKVLEKRELVALLSMPPPRRPTPAKRCRPEAAAQSHGRKKTRR